MDSGNGSNNMRPPGREVRERSEREKEENKGEETGEYIEN